MEHDYEELEKILSQPFSDQGECESIIAQAHAWLIKSKGELQRLRKMPFDNLVSLGLHHGPRLIGEILGEGKDSP